MLPKNHPTQLLRRQCSATCSTALLWAFADTSRTTVGPNSLESLGSGGRPRSIPSRVATTSVCMHVCGLTAIISSGARSTSTWPYSLSSSSSASPIAFVARAWRAHSWHSCGMPWRGVACALALRALESVGERYVLTRRQRCSARPASQALGQFLRASCREQWPCLDRELPSLGMKLVPPASFPLCA